MAESQSRTSWFKISAALLAVFLLALWLFNLKNVWRLSGEEAADAGSGLAWTNLKNDLDRTLASARGQFKAVTAEQAENEEAGRNFLLTLWLKARPQAAPATTTPATSSPVIIDIDKDCPQWIDCMPRVISPGDKTPPRPCQVPPGCEGITQIAY